MLIVIRISIDHHVLKNNLGMRECNVHLGLQYKNSVATIVQVVLY